MTTTDTTGATAGATTGDAAAVLAELALLVADGGVSIVDLEQERFAEAPWNPVQHPGFHFGLNRRHEAGEAGRTSAAGLVIAVEHFGTHIDAFCHQAYDGRMFGDVAVTPAVQSDRGFTVHGAETIAPFVTRGVLLDVARHCAHPGPDGWYSEADLRTAAAAAGVEVGAGDVVLVRTGAGALWAAGDPSYGHAPGIAASASRWLADQGVRAVGADNMAWDVVGAVDPDAPELGSFPGHVLLLVRAGIHIFENLDLDGLSESGAAQFVFVSAPLKIRGATGSPTRPLALVATRADRPSERTHQ